MGPHPASRPQGPSGGSAINNVPANASEPPMWEAPRVTQPIDATVAVPASKSLTNRYLVLAALADGPCTIHNTLISRDSELMLSALAALGARIERENHADGSTTVFLAPPDAPRPGPLHIDCGLAGTVMRFVPALAAALGTLVGFDGDASARVRPMKPVLDAVAGLGVAVDYGNEPGFLPFSIDPAGLAGREQLLIDASGSSQFISAMLLAGPGMPGGLRLRAAQGPVASPEHIEMTVQTLRELGVAVTTDPDGRGWQVSEGRIAAFTVTVEPDLSNAGPFLAAAMATGGTVRIPHWPASTTQIGGRWVQILTRMGARVELGADSVLSVHGPERILPIDYADAAELTPTLAALCALATGESRLSGIGHLRGHETDRLTALQTELGRIGVHVDASADALRIVPGPLHGADLHSYEDHRMATAGAILGLAIDGVRVQDIATTAKTMPDFPQLWARMVATAATAGDAASAASAGDAASAEDGTSTEDPSGTADPASTGPAPEARA